MSSIVAIVFSYQLADKESPYRHHDRWFPIRLTDMVLNSWLTHRPSSFKQSQSLESILSIRIGK